MPQSRPHNVNIILNGLSSKYVNLITNDEHTKKMTDTRMKREVVRRTRTSSQIESRRDLHQSERTWRNFQNQQHAWHDQNLQVPHQYQHHNFSAHQQFYSHEGLTRYDEYGRPYFVQLHPPSEVFHSPHHLQHAQNPQTFVQQEYTHHNNNQQQHNSPIYGGVTLSQHTQQQSAHNSGNYIQQLPPHGLGFYNGHDNVQVLDRDLGQLALTPGHATSSEPQEEDALIQKHSREHVKVMIEFGNKKRIKHPGDTIIEHDSSKSSKLNLEIISEHHPVHTKPSELQIKTLPMSETLRRDATLGGYIFLCKDETMDLEIMNQLFGMCDFM